MVGFNHHRLQFAALASVHAFHHTRHRRHHFDLFVVFVVKQHITGSHTCSLFHFHSRYHSPEVVGYHRKMLRLLPICHFRGGNSPLQAKVEAFFQFYQFCHKMIDDITCLRIHITINFVQSYNFYTYNNVGIYRKFLSSSTFLFTPLFPQRYLHHSTTLSMPLPRALSPFLYPKNLKKKGKKSRFHFHF